MCKFRPGSGNVLDLPGKTKENQRKTWKTHRTPGSEFLRAYFFGEVRFFFVITRDHGSFGGRHQVEVLPTGLPELFKPARDLLEPRKFEMLGPKFSS